MIAIVLVVLLMCLVVVEVREIVGRRREAATAVPVDAQQQGHVWTPLDDLQLARAVRDASS